MTVVAAVIGVTMAAGALGAVSLTRSMLPAAAATKPDHVVVVIMENHGYSQIIGSSSAPYINSLANANALMTQSFAIGHPSEPNYLELWSGSNQGVTDDSCPHTFSAGSLGTQLLAAGLSVKGFNESMPADGSLACTSGSYARKHNPLADWTATADAAHDKTYASWPSDFTTLPTVSLVVPNLCSDMHDCSVATGDGWLKTHFDPYVQWAKSHNSLAIMTFDEDNGNHIATVFAGQGVIAGKYSEHITHYNVLRTIGGFYGLPGLANAASTAQITDVFGTTLPPSPLPSLSPSPSPSHSPSPSPSPSSSPSPKPSPSPSPTPTVVRTVPGPPTDVHAGAGNHSAQVSWTRPSTDGGSPILSYRVQASDGTTASVGASQTSTTLKHLKNGVGYSFVVRAVNGMGASLPSLASNTVVPQTPNHPATTGGGPHAPSSLATTAGASSLPAGGSPASGSTGGGQPSAIPSVEGSHVTGVGGAVQSRLVDANPAAQIESAKVGETAAAGAPGWSDRPSHRRVSLVPTDSTTPGGNASATLIADQQKEPAASSGGRLHDVGT